MDPSKLFRNVDIRLHRTGSAASDSDGSLAANVKMRPRLDPSALKPKVSQQLVINADPNLIRHLRSTSLGVNWSNCKCDWFHILASLMGHGAMMEITLWV